MLNLKRQGALEGDPRADYTRSLVDLVRIGDLVAELTPQEAFEAVCEAVAQPLDLDAVVMIDALDGRPRMMSWKAEHAHHHDVAHAEWRAWSCFTALVLTNWLPELLAIGAEPDRPSALEWSAQPLSAPPRGIIECGTRRPLHRVDHGLLKCASARLSMALGRPRASDNGRGKTG